MIALDHISKTFSSGGVTRQIVRNVTVTLPDVRGLALIGRNGAGKSTLLRLISGTLRPDRGCVRTDESISWPMGFSGGFHPALSGAQNTRFVARIYGKDPLSLEDYVRGFADLGDAFHTPVETYSSGMKARLAFAVSMGITFDCYLIDEIIGVGDAEFRARCRKAFQERASMSRLIMVSHNPEALRLFCQAGLVLQDGRLSYFPSLEDALAYHHASGSVPPQARIAQHD